MFYTCETAYAKARGQVELWSLQGTAAPVMRKGSCRSWPGQTAEGSKGHGKELYLTSNEKPLRRNEQIWVLEDLSGVSGRTNGGGSPQRVAVRKLVCSPCKGQRPLGWASLVAVERRRIDRANKCLEDKINNSSWMKYGGVMMTEAVMKTKHLNEIAHRRFRLRFCSGPLEPSNQQ